MIPETEIPEETEGYQGFYHLIGIESRCEEAKLSYIIVTTTVSISKTASVSWRTA